jgi:threonylcarbamoyladenosine tRNA methylthiotransferase MtaB
MRIALDTLGCKLNQAETELLSRELTCAGHEIVSRTGPADIYILNTCTVTRIADSKSRHLLRQARRSNPDALIVAAGCYAQRVPAELAHIKEVDLIIGNDRKMDLPGLLADLGYTARCAVTGEIPLQQSPAPRTRSFLKIQDGCTSFCSYCIVPLVRGNETSLPASEVVAEVVRRTDEGCKEVVLTGTKVGTYSHNGINLHGLLERILSKTSIPRLRLSSLQPGEIAPDLIRLWDDDRLCPHFHLSLQSGSDAVLHRMKRHYLTRDFRRAVSLILECLPDAAITTDVITGFPGETDKEFEESYRFCREMGFARIHVFPYSARSGTEAASLPGHVHETVKQERTQRMLVLAEESAGHFRQRFSGKSMTVLWEQRIADGRWSGVTENYIRTYVESEDDLANKLLPVTLP